MKDSRLTFFSPTNFSVPVFVYQTIFEDCQHFDYFKIYFGNYSGFLNRLLPSLAKRRRDLHKQFLIANNNDEKLTKKIEENIYKVYFNKNDFCDDATYNIALRINKKYYDDFLMIHDIDLKKYDMDFTTYLRSLLIEYSLKNYAQREYCFFYPQVLQVKDAITKHQLCHFHLNNNKRLSFIPVLIDYYPLENGNLIGGVSEDKKTAFYIRLANLEQVIVDKDVVVPITDDDCVFVLDSLLECMKELKKEEGESEEDV